MPPYAIDRIPNRYPKDYWATPFIPTCVVCQNELTTIPNFPWLMRCLVCNCNCGYRKEDLFFFSDGLVFPCCQEHWDAADILTGKISKRAQYDEHGNGP